MQEETLMISLDYLFSIGAALITLFGALVMSVVHVYHAANNNRHNRSEQSIKDAKELADRANIGLLDHIKDFHSI